MHSETVGQDSLSWVSDLADTLIREIFQETANISLFRQEQWPQPPAPGQSLVAISSKADGAYVTQLMFRGELSLLYQIASNMLDVPSPCFEDAVDYGLELFNMFCGRFISEVYRTDGVPARFYPPRYLGEQACELSEDEESIYYCSQNGKLAQFSWTANSLEQLLIRRTAKNEA